MNLDSITISIHEVAAAFIAVASLFSGLGYVLGCLAAGGRPRR